MHRCLTSALCVLVTLGPRALLAQHEEGEMHFSHPLMVESPSPDTKIRANVLWATLDDGGQMTTTRTATLGGEYAFRPWISVEGEVPFVSTDEGGSTRSGLASSELSLKLASLHFHNEGILLGGGVGSELPTGSDSKGGGNRLGLSAFADVGWLYHKLEVVSFVTTSSELRDGGPGKQTLALSASALFHAGSFVDLIAEDENTTRLNSGEGAQTVVAPGFKVHGRGHEGPMAGLSVQLPIGNAREFDRQFMFSFMYHF